MTRPLQPGDELPPRTVVARNTAAAEVGSIHDDTQASRVGYQGGLVPGVTLLAYLTPSLVDALGEAWPERGRLRARFVRPAYEGEALTARAAVAEVEARSGGADITLDCRLERPDGAPCLEAEAACLVGGVAPEPGPWRQGPPVSRPARRPPPGGELPPLRPEALVAGEELSPLTYHLSLEETTAWAAQAEDDHPWYGSASPFGGRPIVPPALFARDPIRLVRHSYARKATVHAASDLAYQRVGWPDRDYTVRGYIAEVYERKGNHYLVVDALTVDQEGREIVRNRHTSLIRLRAEAEASG